MKILLLTITLIFLSFTALYADTSTPISYSLTTTEGNTINISETKEGLDFQEFQGKAVLLVLFGHQCPPCLREIPEFIALTKKHKNDLAIIAIESQNYPVDEVQTFQKEHKMNYNVIPGINHNDFISYIAMRAGYNTMSIPLPLLIAVDKYGKVQYVQAGQLSKNELEFLVEKLNE